MNGRGERGVVRAMAPGLLVLALLALGLVLAPAPAAACADDVRKAERDLTLLQRNVHKAAADDRAAARDHLADAARTIGEARRRCAGAKGFADQALATAKVVAARASLAAADGLIPDN